MNDVIPCCKNCRYSYGNGDNVFCIKNNMHENGYNACLMYEEREVKCDENSDADKK